MDDEEQTKPDKCSLEDNSIDLCAKNENAEIGCLQLDNNALELPKQAVASKQDKHCDDNDDDDRLARIEFNCVSCSMNEMVHYFGLAPPFANGITFREPTYILRDPFQPPPPRGKGKAEYFIAIGADCSICHKAFCKGAECSFFYIRTYCMRCAWDQFDKFPTEIQNKLRKHCI